MKVTLNWLKEYVAFDWSPEELKERLTMLGLEVEGRQTISGEFQGVVVAQILASEKHPNADRLSVCRVTDGKEERTIVCGAKNYQVNDKVPLALPGCALPAKPGEKPFVIKASKMRGVESHGMLCSAAELGLAEDAEGLLILPPDAPVGQGLAEYYGRSREDVVYDLEITPNRPDWNSLLGIAREISALTGNPLKLPALPSSESGGGSPVENHCAVRVEDAGLCPRYVARYLHGVQIGPSPDWLRQILEKVGLRSINNVVDITNFVMLETGQPLHAFDYHLLSAQNSAPVIVVRRARDGEAFTTLDGQAHVLSPDVLVIADETQPVALAGIMGGKNSEINEKTTDVLLESAHFKPQNIRATSKRFALRTDASYRFERGTDVGMVEWASQRAAQLIVQIAGGTLAQGAIDACPQPPQPRQISLRPAQTNRLLGVEIPAQEQTEYLRRLGLEILDGPARGGADRPSPSGESNGEPITVKVPSHRLDLKREVDLIEEVARLYGVDRIPAATPRCIVGSHSYDDLHDELSRARHLLSGLGLSEAQGQTLVPRRVAEKLNRPLVSLQHPLSSEMDVLRPSLLPGLLDALGHNLSRKVTDVALFEIGRVFLQDKDVLKENRALAFALTGRRHPPFWQGDDTTFDIFDLKGILSEFLEHYGLSGIRYRRQDPPPPIFIEAASLSLGKLEVGVIGQLLPPLAKQYDLKDRVLLAELDLDVLLPRRTRERSFKPLPAFPAVRRDVAMLAPETLTHETVVQTIQQAKPAHLANIELFDIFRGKNVPEGQKSMAYALIYRHGERTLTDQEVNASQDKLLEHLRRHLGVVIRDR